MNPSCSSTSRGRLAAALLVASAAAATAGCGRSATRASTGPGEPGGDPAALAPPMDEPERAQWAAARDGDPDERMRLVDLVGCEGLRERALGDASLRGVAIRSMQYCGDGLELPWLAEAASGANDADALAALEAIGEIAARPRRSTDPEDALELHEGCAALLALARAHDRPRERRVLAVRALRMLAERGCVSRSEIPSDLDAR